MKTFGGFAILETLLYLEDIAILGDLATLWSLDYDALVLIDVLEGLIHLVVSYIWRLWHGLDGGLIGGLHFGPWLEE